MSQWMSQAGLDAERDKYTRKECLAIHDSQDRECRGIGWEEIEKRTSPAGNGLNPSMYWFLRTHPINVRLPWIMFYLGSVVKIDYPAGD